MMVMMTGETISGTSERTRQFFFYEAGGILVTSSLETTGKHVTAYPKCKLSRTIP